MRKLILLIALLMSASVCMAADDIVINGDFDDQGGENSWQTNWYAYYQSYINPALGGEDFTVADFGYGDGTTVHQFTGQFFGDGTTTFVMKARVRGADGWGNENLAEGAKLAILATDGDPDQANWDIANWTVLADSGGDHWFSDTDPDLWVDPYLFFWQERTDGAGRNVTPWYEYTLVYDYVADAPGAGIGLAVYDKESGEDPAASMYGWTHCDWVQLFPLRATLIAPANDADPLDNQGEVGTLNGGTGLIDVQLAWGTAEDVAGAARTDITAHYLYLQETDPNFVGTAPYATIPAGTNTYDLTGAEGLNGGSSYYWKIEEAVSSAYNNVATLDGTVWAFETLSKVAIITNDPNDILVAQGADASFEVLATSPIPVLDIEWFISDDKVADGVPEDTLFDSGSNVGVLTNADAALHGGKFVYCDVINADGPATTDFALLEVERLMAHWQMNNSMIDSVAAPIYDGWNGSSVKVPGVDYGTGVHNQAMNFYGDPNIMSVPGSEEAFNNYHLGLTASAWVNTSSPGWKIVMGKQARLQDEIAEGQYVDYYYGWSLNISPDGQPQLSVYDGAAISAGEDIDVADGQWHLITGTFGADGAAMYVDGVLEAEAAPWDTVPLPNDRPVEVGGQLSTMDINLMETMPWVGMIDEVKIYNYPISAAEVLDIYNTHATTLKNECVDQPAADVSGPAGEPDCKVDIYDFAELASVWMTEGMYPTP